MFRRLWTWWTKEIGSLIPKSLRVMFAGGSQTKTLELKAGLDRVQFGRHVGEAPLELLTGQEGVVFPKARKRLTVDVVLPDSHLLMRRVQAPRKLASRLNSIAEIDLKSTAPFPEGSVIWALGQLRREDDLVVASQWVAKVADVQKLKAALTRVGLALGCILAKTENGDIVLADYSDHSGAKTWKRLNAILLCLTIIAATGASLRPAWNANRDIAALSTEVAALREQVFQLRRNADALEAEANESARLQRSFTERPRLVEVLREATVALPDEAWISTMTYTGNTLTLVGETSGTAVDAVLSFGERSAFSNPRLTGPTTRVASGRERFELAADVRGVE